jgi:hypothetical protein
LQLCRIYACTPLELDAQPAGVVFDHWACIHAEGQHAKLEERRRNLRPRKR